MKTRTLRVANLLAALFISLTVLSCDRDAKPKSEMAIETGPAYFMKLGGAISSFVVFFEVLGDKPIEEYGIVYTFDDDVKDNYPDLTDSKVVFELPAKQYSNEKVVNIGFPSTAHWIGYRAYAKLKGGEIKYAEPMILNF